MIMMMWCNEVKDENKISNQERGGPGPGPGACVPHKLRENKAGKAGPTFDVEFT